MLSINVEDLGDNVQIDAKLNELTTKIDSIIGSIDNLLEVKLEPPTNANQDVRDKLTKLKTDLTSLKASKTAAKTAYQQNRALGQKLEAQINQESGRSTYDSGDMDNFVRILSNENDTLKAGIQAQRGAQAQIVGTPNRPKFKIVPTDIAELSTVEAVMGQVKTKMNTITGTGPKRMNVILPISKFDSKSSENQFYQKMGKELLAESQGPVYVTYESNLTGEKKILKFTPGKTKPEESKLEDTNLEDILGDPTAKVVNAYVLANAQGGDRDVLSQYDPVEGASKLQQMCFVELPPTAFAGDGVSVQEGTYDRYDLSTLVQYAGRRRNPEDDKSFFVVGNNHGNVTAFDFFDKVNQTSKEIIKDTEKQTKFDTAKTLHKAALDLVSQGGIIELTDEKTTLLQSLFQDMNFFQGNTMQIIEILEKLVRDNPNNYDLSILLSQFQNLNNTSVILGAKNAVRQFLETSS